MHSFHQSRARVGFDVLCALAISGSCIGAWMQTGALGMLSAAVVSLLYGLVHLFDMRRPKAAPAVEARSTAPSVEGQGELLSYDPAAAAAPAPRLVAVAEQPEAMVEEPLVIEEVVPATPAKARKSPRKRTKKAPTPVTDAAPVTAEPTEPAPLEELDHGPVTPLFEPEPFVRQQRAVFGRKAG